MKKLYLAALMISAISVTYAQRTVNINGKTYGVAANSIEKQAPSEKTTGTYYVDYEAYDASLAQSTVNFVEFLNKNYGPLEGDTGSFYRILHLIDTMIVTQDYSNYNFIDQSSVQSILVDSIFVALHHQNNSGQNDTLTISIIPVDGNGRPDIAATPLWTDQVITDTSLTAPSTGSGYPISVFNWTPNITLNAPNTKFAITVEYSGALVDTFAFRFGWPSTGAACASFGVNAPIASEAYPTAYYQVNVGPNGPSVLFPRQDGTFYWYLDCNQNGTAEAPDENIYQYYTIWASLTVTDNMSAQDFESNGYKLSQNAPNPSNGATNISYEMPSNGEVVFTVTDLSGKVVSIENVGNRNAGKHTYQLNTENLNAGVYFYTMTSNGNKLTKRMIVSK